MLTVDTEDDLVCITSQGNLIKTPMDSITTQGRNAGGVNLVNIARPDIVVGTARAAAEEAATEE